MTGDDMRGRSMGDQREDQRDGVPVIVNRSGAGRMVRLTRSRISQMDMPTPDVWIEGGSGELIPAWSRATVREWDGKPGPKRGRV